MGTALAQRTDRKYISFVQGNTADEGLRARLKFYAAFDAMRWRRMDFVRRAGPDRTGA